MLRRVYDAALQGAWAVLLLALPLTSFPLASRIMGSTMVAPASVLVLVVLLLAWFLPYILRRGTLPWQALPLFGLLSVALVSALLAFSQPLPAFREVEQWRTTLEAFLTLVVGICFFLIASAWVRTPESLAFSLRWINYGGCLMVVWTLLQGAYWYGQQGYPDWMVQAQSWISSSKLFDERMVGTTFEPSWLAHALNMIYLPFWLAATVRGFSVHRWRLWKITLENVLLVGGMGGLLLSVSRVGLLAFLLMLGFLVALANLAFLRWVENKIIGRGRKRNLVLRAGLLLGLCLFYLVTLLGAALYLRNIDRRMASVLDFETIREHSFEYYANRLVFAERVVFWQAGWAVFNDAPILGVGPGNAGYYFPEKLTPFSWNLTEVRRAMYEWMSLPNIKSLWVRLLAETGIVGFAFFVCWCYTLWQSARFLNAHPGRFYRTVGLMGWLVIVALLVEGFSVDTFALPYFWVALGLVTAGSQVARCLPQNQGLLEIQNLASS